MKVFGRQVLPLNETPVRRAVRVFLAHRFLFEELVKRDFKKKYKRTVLGMGWSVLSPLLLLLVLKLVFGQFFGKSIPHYTIYLFCGQVVFLYFNEAVGGGMVSLMENASIFTKVNVPKYLFLFAKTAQTTLNFLIILAVFFGFCAIDGIRFGWHFLLLLYPIVVLMLFNLGLGLVLSALYVFFRDMAYLWSVFTRLLFYGSAVMYSIEKFPESWKRVYMCNPIYMFIAYFRKVTIDGAFPSLGHHAILAGWALFFLFVGSVMYKKFNTKFLYYV
ncbi:MAG: ABC transporter permease [Kiritimatiellae bacterium]|nr:ABC transporter permease [Kiritimatiellia bacterium]